MPKPFVKSNLLPCLHGFYGREGCDVPHLQQVRQVHGAACVWVNAPLEDEVEADAMVSTEPDIALAIKTADCAPVLFFAPSDKVGSGGVVGAAHAGWYGAFSGVLEATIVEMMRAGAKLEDISAVVGPCIAKASYEVSADFEKPFIAEDMEAERFFSAGKTPDKRFFDLAGYCAFRLARAGVGRVQITGHDTYALKDAYFSHRRGVHANIKEDGRQLSVISLKLS